MQTLSPWVRQNEEIKPAEEGDINEWRKECRYWADKWDIMKNSNRLKRMTSMNDEKSADIEQISKTKQRNLNSLKRMKSTFDEKKCRRWAVEWDKKKISNWLKRMTSINEEKSADIEQMKETKWRIQTIWWGWHH